MRKGVGTLERGGGRGKVGGLGMRADLAFGMILVPFLAFGLPSLISGITQKICVLCFVVINSVFLNFLCVWIFLAPSKPTGVF